MAQALTWLLTTSQSGETISEAVHAIAGLPTTPTVQDQLLCHQTVDILTRILTVELTKKSSCDTIKKSSGDLAGKSTRDGSNNPPGDLLSACLYALLHLVQCAPANAEDKDTLDALRALLAPNSVLSLTDALPDALRAIALCVKCRIILLYDERSRDLTLFDTDIPILIQSCEDAHLRRLLFEVHFLADEQSGFLFALRDRNMRNRDKAHVNLIKVAIGGAYNYFSPA
jgi:hypothetical protein